MIKRKTTGRPPGSANKKSEYVRDENGPTFRCTRGFNQCLQEIKEVTGAKSKSDVLHDALELLANKKLPDSFYWRGKIQ